MTVSIFNDVIGPVMRGPSSSHCAAALRIGRLARDLVGGDLQHVLIQFDESGSLPATHTSQGSDMGLFGGLLGWEAHDERLPNSRQHLIDNGIAFEFEYGDFGDAHPNTYRLTVCGEQESHTLIAISTGGGMIEVTSIDDFEVRMDGGFDETLVRLNAPACDDTIQALDCESLAKELLADHVHVRTSDQNVMLQIQSSQRLESATLQRSLPWESSEPIVRLAPVLPIRSRPQAKLPFQDCSTLTSLAEVDSKPLWKWAVEYETQRGGLTEREVLDRMIKIVQIARTSIESGLNGTEYADRVLGYQSGGFRDKLQSGQLLDAGALNQIVLYTTAMMEVKSSMGVIIAAPTAGACAALPATCLAMGESLSLSDEEIAKAFLAAGLIGVFIATAWSFAAEVGGCQAEGGSAAAMSAAALVTMAGGTTTQATGAASMALQNMLGLICDPVANRVEVPCLGKNVIAASNAISCANMCLAGFDPVIPLDETIDAARRVSERMPREHRCTALGGLATTPTSLQIEKRLQQCGSGCGCSGGAAPIQLDAKVPTAT
ncbi:L-serine ammonia-lyase, iron-sulfur-dependent, subunit alpha [Rhodopirellula sp. P2]|uniref:L-serine ammonia-lyase, iron-sulfur-dependent, subunit alpha n=1 Tax=Rhodopirellula sp. P2 TaxID=2127060 RepID=UPI0023676ED0|nr:L-serine ammonia-lyase, iron-sulfur-dependent, subunit alpha [Rhodopirellula sp. P2]WDQ18050.1 L-serine ammonia-lyase, iron-sulfur-dependent, subunit alpha [Rhodopirellula sp. P2]